MSMKINIFLANQDILIPKDSDDKPDPYVNQLIKDYVTLYVDTRNSEIAGYLPGKTTLRRDGNRVENLFFQFQSNSNSNLLTDVAAVIESTHETIEKSVSDKRSQHTGFPEEITSSGLFEEGWEFTNPDRPFFNEIDQLYPLLLRDSDATFPSIGYVRERALLRLIEAEGSQLQLGIKDFKTAAQVIKFFVENRYETSIAIYRNGDKELLTSADIVLVPGHRNFDALNQQTRTALNRSVDKVKGNLKSELTNTGGELIDDLVTADDVSTYSKVYDLKQAQEYIKYDQEATSFRSTTGENIAAHYNRVRTSQYLSEEQKENVQRQLVDKVGGEYETLANQVITETARKLNDYIDHVESIATNSQEEYTYYRNIDRYINENEWRNNDASTLSQPEFLNRFAETWRGVVSEQGPGEDVARHIQDDVETYLNKKLKFTREQIVDVATEEFRTHISNIALTTTLTHRERLRALKLAKQSLENHSYLESLQQEYNNTNKLDDLIRRLSQLVNREGIDKKTANQIETRVTDLLDKRIDELEKDSQDYYEKEINNKIQELSESDYTGVEKQQQLKTIKKLLEEESVQELRNRSTTIQNIHSTIESLETSSLPGERKDDVRKGALNYVQRLESSLEQQSPRTGRGINKSSGIMPQFKEVLNNLEEEYKHIPEIILERLDEIEKVVRDETYNQHHDEKFVRKAAKRLRDEYSQGKPLGEDKEKLLTEINHRQSIYRTQEDEPDGRIGTIVNSVPSLSLPVSRRAAYVGFGFVIVAAIVVVALALGITPVGGVDFLEGAGPLGGDDPIELDITSPDPYEEISENAVNISGETTASQVDIHLEHTKREYTVTHTASSDDGEFEEEFAGLPLGPYIATVEANSTEDTTTQQTAFTYDGAMNDVLSLTDIESDGELGNDTFELTGETNVDHLTVSLYNNNGTQVLTEQIPVFEGPGITEEPVEFEQEIQVPSSGIYVLTVSVTGFEQGSHTSIRVLHVSDQD